MDTGDSSYRPRDLVVGAFVLAGIVVVFWGIFKTSTLGFGKTRTYHVRYANVATLKKGSHVKYHGLLVGRVNDLRVDPDVPRVILVTVEIKESIPVTEETIARITKADILGDEFIDLRSMGTAAGTAGALRTEGKALQEGEFIAPGEPFDLGAALERAQQIIEVLHDVAATVQRESEQAFSTLNEIAENANELLSDENRAQVETAIADLSRSLALARQVLESNGPRIDETMESVKDASVAMRDVADGVGETLEDMRPQLKELTTQLAGAVAHAQGLMDSVDTTLKSMDLQQVNDLIANLETTSRHLAEFTRDIKERPYLLIRREKVTRSKEPAP